MKLEPVAELPPPAKRRSKLPALKTCLICEVELTGNRVISCGQIKCVSEVWKLANYIRDLAKEEASGDIEDLRSRGWA